MALLLLLLTSDEDPVAPLPGDGIECTFEIGDGTFWVPGTWTDFSDRVYSWTCTGGFTAPWKPPLKWGPMRISLVVDNSDRALDPRNDLSDYWDATLGGLTIRPGSPVRFQMAGINLFYGTLDDISISSTRMPSSKVTITATDGSKILSGSAVTPYAVAEGAGEDVIDRLIRLAEAAEWPAGMRSFQAEPGVTLQATTLEGPLWEQMQLTAASGGGYIYLSSDGDLLYRARSHDSTVSVGRFWSNQNTYGKGITINVEQSQGQEAVINQVRYMRVGGVEQLVTTRVAGEPIKDLTRSDLICEDDATVLELATLALSVAPKPRPQIVKFEADSATGTNWVLELVHTRPGDRTELLEDEHDINGVYLRTINQESFIRSASWSGSRINRSNEFYVQASYGVQPSWAWDALTLDSPTKGVLGQNVTLPTGYGTEFTGRRTFAADEEMTAAWFNSLMAQRILTFADIAARDAAFVTAPTSRELTWLVAEDRAEVWDGTVWQPIWEGV